MTISIPRHLLLLLLATFSVFFCLATWPTLEQSSQVKPFIQTQRVLHEETVNVTNDFNTRKRVVEKFCAGHQTLKNKSLHDVDLRMILVDDKYEFLYCKVPKVACTNWVRVLLKLTGKYDNYTSPVDIPAWLPHEKTTNAVIRPLSSYSAEEIDYRVRNYFKFMFVRHPLERLVSAWRNKFVRPNAVFPKSFGRKIIRKYRANATDAEITNGTSVTFQEFSRFVQGPAGRNANAHWKEFHELCHPCHVAYDVIGREESFARDVEYVLGVLGVKDVVQFPKLGEATPQASGTWESYIKELPNDVLAGLKQTYDYDMEMFEYKMP